MAIPLSYNLRSLRVRWASTVVAVLGIAGTVGVFIAMLSLAQGFRMTLVSSGSESNAIVMRSGATSEMMSAVPIDTVKTLADEPGVARDASGSLVSAEAVVIAAFPLKSSGTDANVQVRGVSDKVLGVRPVKIVAGRFFRPGLNELVVGGNVDKTYEGLDLGSKVKFGGATWEVVGVFDARGSAFDSEVWGDATVVKQVYKRSPQYFSSVTVRLNSASAFDAFRDKVTTDPRLNVSVERERDYYDKESQALTNLIQTLGLLVTLIMGVGAVFGALNTMYSAVAERSREIATMRALGFGTATVVTSFVFEALVIALIGGLVGCVATLPLNGLTTSTLNFATFSHLAFAFRVTPPLLISGVIFALMMGLIGGVPPALRAATARIAVALREL